MGSILEDALKEIVDGQMLLVEKAGEWLADRGQDFIDDACLVGDAVMDFLASITMKD